jgi:hypothetical protein
MTFGSTFGRTFSPSFQPKSQAAGGYTTWWTLDGAITSCVAAYQPKGAASYAASKTNLANPGTYDATNGAAYPTWDVATGWTFNNASSQYLNSNITPTVNGQWSVIINYAYTRPATYSYPTVFGCQPTPNDYPQLTLCVENGTSGAPSNNTVLRNGHITGLTITPRIDSGTVAIAGNKAYSNGSLVGTLTVGSVANTYKLYIGAINNNANIISFFNGIIKSLAIYNATLTAPQVAALTTAMAAL